MKRIIVALLLFCGLLALASGQENRTAPEDASAIGIPTGAQAPSFRLADQFGHEQSNATLRGSKGTVLLFFRSADW